MYCPQLIKRIRVPRTRAYLVILLFFIFLKEVTWWMEHLRCFFFLANGAGAMNSNCRELLFPQTGIAALTLTVMKGFEARKEWFPCILPISVYSAYSSTLRSFTSGGSRTRVRWLADRRSNHYTTQFAPIHP